MCQHPRSHIASSQRICSRRSWEWQTSLQPCWDQVFLAKVMGSPLPHTKGATQISSKPIAFPVPSTWINEQDIIQLAKGRAGGRKGSCPGDDSRLHGQEGLCNDNMVNTLFSSWDRWRHLCCHPGFGGSRLKEAPLKNVLFPRAFLLIYCSGHFQRPPQASISNGTGLMETL